MPTLNLGILAHVDAGKTTLTERLLFAADAIDAAGSVDEGTTHTDTLALERQRGITIRAAVAAFTVDGLTVNIIDTPGHPDFIAEVDRSLRVLDGAVLVVSAVEGVQAQTVVLLRALQRLTIPTVVFVNKIDRPGADPDRVVAVIRERLSRHVAVMGTVGDAGTPAASFAVHRRSDPAVVEALTEVLADLDDHLMAAFLEGDPVLVDDLWTRLAEQVAAAVALPVFFGSAITGAGIAELMVGMRRLLPCANGDPDAEVSAAVFKVERGRRGEKIAYARVFTGALRARTRLQWGSGASETVTGLEVFEHGTAVERSTAVAGQVTKLQGLRDVRVGDTTGSVPAAAGGGFAPPTIETAIVPRDPSEKGALHVALAQLAEQDPLINLHQDDARQELIVSLYGEVQQEVIQQTIAAELGIGIDFRETTTICVERPRGRGDAVEWLGRRSNPFLATVGLRVEPAPVDSGISLRLELDLTAIPLYVYKAVPLFREAMEGYVRSTLEQGLEGWQVNDCLVTMTDCGYSSPGTSAADFRKLTPLVLMSALEQAGTTVCEPIHHFHLEAPTASLSAVLALLAQLRATPRAPIVAGRWFTLGGVLPAVQAPQLQRNIRALTHGEGALELVFDRYAPVTGTSPSRPRFDHNPLSRQEYLRHVLRRG